MVVTQFNIKVFYISKDSDKPSTLRGCRVLVHSRESSIALLSLCTCRWSSTEVAAQTLELTLPDVTWERGGRGVVSGRGTGLGYCQRVNNVLRSRKWRGCDGLNALHI